LPTFQEALQIASRAQNAYNRAETKAEVEDIFLRYGKNGVGYRPLCRILFSHIAPETALKGYNKGLTSPEE
jgi:hypothetical protein